jgi:hypothetical protein
MGSGIRVFSHNNYIIGEIKMTDKEKTTWKWVDCFTGYQDDGKWLLTEFEYRMTAGKHYCSELKTVNFVATMSPKGVEFTARKNHCEYDELSVDEMLEFIKFYVEKEGRF